MSQSVKRDAPQARPALPKISWAWLGVVPFFLFAFMFLIYPASTIAIRSFQDSTTNAFTFKNILGLNTPFILSSYWVSIKISVVTALGGGIFGFLLAYSAIRGGLPRFMRSSLMTFCGVASNFAGVPLAFAFIALLSPTGVLDGVAKGHRPEPIQSWLHTVYVLGIEHSVYVLPIPVDGIDHFSGNRWLAARMAGGFGESGSHCVSILAICGFPDPVALLTGYNDPAFWKCLWSLCYGFCTHRRSNQPGDDRDRRTTARRCAQRPWVRLCPGIGNGDYHGHSDYRLHDPAATDRKVAEMKRSGLIWSWFWMILGILYFFLPLVATFLFSLRAKLGVLSFMAYQNVFNDPMFVRSFGFSVLWATLTIIVGVVLFVPTAYWVRLKLPQFRAAVEFITLLPFVVPAIVFVFGLVRTYSHPPLLIVDSPAVLVAAYTVLSMPYMYRAIDTGLRSIDVRTLDRSSPESGCRLGNGPVPRHPAEYTRGDLKRCFFELCHRDGRVYSGPISCQAGLWPVYGLPRTTKSL